MACVVQSYDRRLSLPVQGNYLADRYESYTPAVLKEKSHKLAGTHLSRFRLREFSMSCNTSSTLPRAPVSLHIAHSVFESSVRLHVPTSDRIDVSGVEGRSTLMVLTCLNLFDSEISDKGTHFVSAKVDICRLAVGGKDPQTTLRCGRLERSSGGKNPCLSPTRREIK